MGKLRKCFYLFIVSIVFIAAAGGMGNVYAKGQPCLNIREISLARGQTAAMSVKNTGKKVSWKSSDKRVASVSKTGKIKAKKKGTAVITATVAKKKYRCKVTVSEKETKTLVVYFSMTKTTESAAKKIAEMTNGTLVCLQPEKSYAKDYDKLLDVAQREQDENARPALATVVKNIKQYDTVILGYPIWWGREPMIIRSFLSKYNFSGKKIVPFCTSGGSGISSSMAGIRKYAKGADVMEGKDLSDASREEIRKWLKKAGVDL